ncbi:MAG: TraB/GumN family protein [Chitinophagaceae bacterium]|nr:MAG: TraB/GumN family protein [Chitinophagaceae bacterium]
MSTIKWSFLTVMYMGIAAGCFAQAEAKPVRDTKPLVKSTSDNTLLWEISGNGLKSPSYLFGTMHILCATDAKLSPNMKQIIRDCNQVYFEIDMDDMGEMMGALKYLRMNDGAKISDLLTAEEYDRVKTYFDKNKSKLPFSMMNRFKPYFVSSMIGEQLMSCKETNGMEAIIMQEAKPYRKEVKGLETTAFQASIFDSIPYKKQAMDLVSYIDSVDHYKGITEEMVKVYLKQDLGKLDKLMQQSDVGMSEYMDLMLYDRNRRWVSLLPDIMKGDGATLFAVGAGHLPGDQGVISLLKKAGFTLKPLKNL